MDSRATSKWVGSLSEGSGEVSLQTGVGGVMDVSWPSRTETAGGKTSPEELIAGAHAACFNMSLSAGLGRDGFTPTSLETTATASFEKGEAGWRLVRMALKVVGDVPGMEDPAFVVAATAAKDGCPVSNALKGNVEITVESNLI
ncbi:MAG: OsmC family peroxiredoxin [Acidimicrobiia bacterium]